MIRINKVLAVVNMKAGINGLISEALRFQAERVSPTTPDLIAKFRIEDEVTDSLRRIYWLSKRLAMVMLPVVVTEQDG